jgi:hypothetical protein
MKNIDVEGAIINEFTSYYLSDELPRERNSSHFLQTELPNMAAESAERLKRLVGENNINKLVKVLQDMRNDTSHPLIKEISNNTLVAWDIDPDNRYFFQILLDTIITSLR